MTDTSILPSAWIASQWISPPAACTISAASATGWITPVSLLTSISETSGRKPCAATACRDLIAQASRDRQCRPASTGQISSPVDKARTPHHARCLRPAAPHRRSPAARRAVAARTASVPPLVNAISSRQAPMAAATVSRAPSTSARALPALGMDRGRIAGQLQRTRHRLARLGAKRRGGVVVAVNAAGGAHAPASYCQFGLGRHAVGHARRRPFAANGHLPCRPSRRRPVTPSRKSRIWSSSADQSLGRCATAPRPVAVAAPSPRPPGTPRRCVIAPGAPLQAVAAARSPGTHHQACSGAAWRTAVPDRKAKSSVARPPRPAEPARLPNAGPHRSGP